MVAGAERHTKNSPARGRIAARLRCRQMIVSDPFIDNLVADQHAKLRLAVILVKVLDVHLVPPCGTVEAKRRRTLLGRRCTLDRLSARSSFTWNNLER